jgi:hypothetical protein
VCCARREVVIAGGLVSIRPDLIDMVRQVPVEQRLGLLEIERVKALRVAFSFAGYPRTHLYIAPASPPLGSVTIGLITLLDRRYWPLLQRPHLTPSAEFGIGLPPTGTRRVSHPCARDRWPFQFSTGLDAAGTMAIAGVCDSARSSIGPVCRLKFSAQLIKPT